ncbi:MAG: hypothetical protein KI785_15080, partial [Devosiaceae bacterium]|nr:hypothetical protein [Devosiaceae bacterium MH13]
DEDGKPTRGAGGGKGWETDWSIEYDKKGRKKSKTTTTTKGRVTTKTTEIFDPKTGKVIKEKTETWLEGPH